MDFIKELDKPNDSKTVVCSDCKKETKGRFARCFLMEYMTEGKNGEYYVNQEPFTYCNSCALKNK